MFKRFEQASKGKLIVTRKLQSQIDYLHKEVGSYEWIGVLLYKKLEGDIASPSTLVIRAEKLFLMDIGTTTTTKAIIDSEEVLAMYDQVPDIFEVKQGLIHTHHTMDSFFSNEDWDELNDNTKNHNYYLSLIVNFKGAYVAKISYMADVQNIFTFKNASDEVKTSTSTQKVMVVFDMDITKESDPIEQDFIDRYEEMKRRNTVTTTVIHSSYYPPLGNAYRSGPPSRWGGQGQDGWDREDPEEGKKEVGEVGNLPTFPEVRETKQAGKTVLSTGPLDRLGHNEARGIALDWLNLALVQEVTTPVKEFNTVIEGIMYFADLYNSRYDTGEYARFNSAMQKLLVVASSDYKPSVTAKRIADIMNDYSYTPSICRLSNDLRDIATNHPQYLAITRKIEGTEKTLKVTKKSK